MTRAAYLSVAAFVLIALYVAAFPRRPIGYFADEARYLLAAQSIAKGHYTDQRDPKRPPLLYPLPGFPLVLSPFVNVVDSHWSRLKALPVALYLLAAWALWRLARVWLGRDVGLAAALLFLLNPTVLDLSSHLLSEPLFVLALLLSGLLLRRAFIRAEHSSPLCVGAGLLIGGITWIRPEGLLWLVAVGLSLLSHRRWKDAARVGVPAVALWFAWTARNWIVSHQMLPLSQNWHAITGYLSSHPMAFLATYAGRFVDMGLGRVLMGIGAPLGPLRILWLLWVVAGLWLIVQGSRRWRQEIASGDMVLKSLGIFIVLYVAVHVAWLLLEERFFVPLLPFALIVILWGAHSYGRRAQQAVIASLVLVYLVGSVSLCRSGGGPDVLPMHTFAWIKQHLGANDRISTTASEVVYLYTGIHNQEFMPSIEPEELRCRLMESKPSSILYQRVAQLEPQVSDRLSIDVMWERSRQEMQRWHGGFELLYENDLEGTALYAVRPDPAGLNACEAYRSATRELRAGREPDAMRHLDQAVTWAPDMTVALNAYAATALLHGGNLELARQRLLHALAIRPSYQVAKDNLARVEAARKASAE